MGGRGGAREAGEREKLLPVLRGPSPPQLLVICRAPAPTCLGDPARHPHGPTIFFFFLRLVFSSSKSQHPCRRPPMLQANTLTIKLAEVELQLCMRCTDRSTLLRLA